MRKDLLPSKPTVIACLHPAQQNLKGITRVPRTALQQIRRITKGRQEVGGGCRAVVARRGCAVEDPAQLLLQPFAVAALRIQAPLASVPGQLPRRHAQRTGDLLRLLGLALGGLGLDGTSRARPAEIGAQTRVAADLKTLQIELVGRSRHEKREALCGLGSATPTGGFQELGAKLLVGRLEGRGSSAHLPGETCDRTVECLSGGSTAHSSGTVSKARPRIIRHQIRTERAR